MCVCVCVCVCNIIMPAYCHLNLITVYLDISFLSCIPICIQNSQNIFIIDLSISTTVL